MFYNLKIAWRKLGRDKFYSAINIGGLAIGMAAAMMILLWVYHQWSYDRFHVKDKYLYKVWCYDETHGNFPNVSYSIGPSLLNEYAGFANMSRYSENEVPLKFPWEDAGKINNIIVGVVDTGFLNMFSFKLLRGDVATALREPNSVVLTQSVAQRIFGDKDPMDETLLQKYGALNIKITGILADPPANTGFRFEILTPYHGNADESWWHPSGNSSFGNRTYVELSPGADVKAISASIRDIIAKHTDGRVATETYLQHISKWHLYNVDKGVSAGGRIETLRMFALIAVLILVIACINFVNLRTAQKAKHNKETGMRRLFGAHRLRLIGDFLGESILVTFLAGMVAMVIIYATLPYFNAMTGEQINPDVENVRFWIATLLFIVVTGVLAGSYPAFYLSSFLPVKVLKGVFKTGNELITPRKALIVTQFTIAVVLMVSTWTIYRQIHHAQARDTGYDKTRLISVQIDDRSRHNRELMRRELLETGVAESVSNNFASMFESEDKRIDPVQWSGKDPESKIVFERNYTEADWAKTTGVQIIQGRDIDIHTYPNDSTAMLLNETAVKIMGFDEPVGEIVYEWNTPYHVVGVVKDFVLESPYDPILPMIIGGPKNGWFNNINIKLSADGTIAEKLEQVERIYQKYNHGQSCRYWIVDEMYTQRFDKEQRISSMVSWFAGLAVFISCLGLFGLSAYMAENRRKEIGIRKVVGASVRDIVLLLSREFLMLVLIALVIAIPVSWLIMSQWLQGYAYRTNLPWYLFAAVGGLTIGIALFTVCMQALRAAVADPVKSIMSGE